MIHLQTKVDFTSHDFSVAARVLDKMSHEVKIHQAQTLILRELLFLPEAGYAELQKPTQLTSDHFNFHISRLVEVGFVEKISRGRYKLTTAGKEYANRLDTDDNTIERQPKSAVMLGIKQKINGEWHYLMQERLKNPYFGYWGFPTGKIRWGETIIEAAARELKEETGLEAKYEFKGIYHEHPFEKESGKLLEDKIFFVISCTQIKGDLIDKFEGGRNEWLTRKQAQALKKSFGSIETEFAIANGKQHFVESKYEYSRQDF